MRSSSQVRSFSPLPPPAAEAERYRVFERIGRGGMAEVFLAASQGCVVNKLVVLKRIWPELASDPTFAAMFLDEARLAVRMSHPNVVQTYEVTEQDDRLTIAMEYLDGQPLTQVLNRLASSGRLGELTLALRLRIVIEILAGLGHVHELADYDGKPLSVVHRDVSPHNVFITYHGHVKLVDFGVAKMVAASQQTRPGTIKGKLAYMAPDQLRPGPVDGRADLFSVGVMLWELLSGRRMWRGMTDVTIVRQLSLGLPLPPLQATTDLPDGLEEICRKALAMNPDDRFASAAEMEGELRRVLPQVADSHTRHLGKLVSMSFVVEREERKAVIDRHLGSGAQLPDESPTSPFTLSPEGDSGRPGELPDETEVVGEFFMPTGPVDDLLLEAPSRPRPVIPRGHPLANVNLRAPRMHGARRWLWMAIASLVCGAAALLALRPVPGFRSAQTMGLARSVSVSVSSSARTMDPVSAGNARAVTETRLEPLLPVAAAGPSTPREPFVLSRSSEGRRGRELGALQIRRRRWARPDDSGGLGSPAVARPLAAGRMDGDVFSIELSEPRPAAHRREIDTESPFLP